MTRKIIIPVDERGNALGEYHHRAKLSDEEVEQIRDLHDAGVMGYKRLARVYDVSPVTIRDVVTYRSRSTTIAGYRTKLLTTSSLTPPIKK